ncbi:MAG: MucB/RseB C-terminal domain-containing protein [Methylovulum sp.]|nr:MucB/RseB C-terminal domain-containing protein [Methylovulum sp.]
MNALKGIFVGLLVSAGNTLAAAPPQTPTAKHALAIMLKSMQDLNYQGTVVFLKNGKLEPMQYTHVSAQGREQERLISLNAPLREIIRDTGNVSCFFKTTQQRSAEHRPFEHSFLIDAPDNPDDLDANYTLTLLGEETIALQPTYIIAIQPKDQLRYARKIWLEKQHFLPLKATVYDHAGKTVEQLVFTELTIKSTLPFTDTQSVKNVTKPTDAVSSAEASFTIQKLPSGFHELFFTRRPLHNSAQPVDHLLLGDGLTLVSVYMEQATNAQASIDSPKAVQSIGAINFFSRTVGGFEFTVMGEVPSETIKLIAENIKLRE